VTNTIHLTLKALNWELAATPNRKASIVKDVIDLKINTKLKNFFEDLINNFPG
jgi:hypothetical protein